MWLQGNLGTTYDSGIVLPSSHLLLGIETYADAIRNTYRPPTKHNGQRFSKAESSIALWLILEAHQAVQAHKDLYIAFCHCFQFVTIWLLVINSIEISSFYFKNQGRRSEPNWHRNKTGCSYLTTCCVCTVAPLWCGLGCCSRTVEVKKATEYKLYTVNVQKSKPFLCLNLVK